MDKYYSARDDKSALARLAPWIAKKYDTPLTDTAKEEMRITNRDL
jgi:hypothetical protein